jgi:hypothetical protein
MEDEMEDKRKPWIRPQLIVLGRGTPEENVLRGCKTSKLTGRQATKTGCCKSNGFNCTTTSNKCSVISKTS